MDFALNDEQKMMIDTIRRFIAQELRPLEDELENQGFLAKDTALAIHQKAKELGLTGEGVTEDALIAAMIAHPVLVERPFVRTAKGTALCRPAERLAGLRAAAMETKDFAPVDAMKALLLAAGVEVRMSKAGVELVAGAGFDADKLEALD